MSDSGISAEVINPPLQLVRLPVDKPQAAVAFLRTRSRGVMDLIAHFWERLAHTPPLQRRDLHLIVATPNEFDNININIPQLDPAHFSGAMLYVPKAHRADVLALDPATAGAFAAYISHHGPRVLRTEGPAEEGGAATGGNVPGAAAAGGERDVEGAIPAVAMLSLTDLSSGSRSGVSAASGGGGTGGSLTANGGSSEQSAFPAESPVAKGSGSGRVPIDFLTGDAAGIGWMTPLLLPLVHKRSPARQVVNVVMQLPADAACVPDPHVRLARESDIPLLNRWRRLYKEERGILFDADMDAWVEHQRVFMYEVSADELAKIPAVVTAEGVPAKVQGADVNGRVVVAVAKIDLDLQDLVEIGGVYTFGEYRNQGYGAGIVRDIACRIRQMGKTPTLQVDEQNGPAMRLYGSAGWRELGRLARVWLTG